MRLVWTCTRDVEAGKFRIFSTILPNGEKEIILQGHTRDGTFGKWYTGIREEIQYFQTPEDAMIAVDDEWGLGTQQKEDV